MLVLSRLRDESVMIGDDVEVKVVDIRGDKVRLGFSAPNWIAVDRKEVFLQKHSNQRGGGVSPEERKLMDPFLRAAIDEAKRTMALAGGGDAIVHPVNLPGTEHRVIVEVPKIAKSDKRLPRPATQAKGKPLI